MDPLDWSTDDVISHLCDDNDFWGVLAVDDRPDPALLAQRLREQAVNGVDLLLSPKDEAFSTRLGLSAKLAAQLTQIKYAVAQSTPSTTTPQETSKDKSKPRRVQLIPVTGPSGSIAQAENLKQRAQLTPVVGGYAGVGKLTPDTVFYGEAALGSALEAEDDDDDNISFTTSRDQPLAPGRNRYIARLTRKLLRADPVTLDDRRVVIYPYSSNFMHKGQIKSASLFKIVGKNSVSVRRVNEFDLDPDVAHENGFDDNGQWDFLAHKYATNDQDNILPALGESDDENEESLSEDTQEDEKESVLEPEGLLTASAAAAAIDEAVASLERKWLDHEYPKLERKAWTIWKAAQGPNRRTVLDNSVQSLSALEARLAHLKNHILSDQWKRKDKLLEQCDAMEATIADKMELEYKRRVWLGSAPRKPIAKLRKPQDDATVAGRSREGDLDSFIEYDEEPANIRVTRGYGRQDNTPLDLPMHEGNSDDDSVLGKSESSDSVLNSDTEDHGTSVNAPIDLTNDDNDPVPTELSTLEEIDAWDLDEVEGTGDRQKFLLRFLRTLPEALLLTLYRNLSNTKLTAFKHELRSGLAALRGAQDSIQGVDQVTFDQIVLTTKLYICWRQCKHAPFSYQGSELQVAAGSTAPASIANMQQFYIYYRKVMVGTGTPFAREVGMMKIGRKRPKHVAPTKGQAIREIAHERRDLAEERARLFEQRVNSHELSADALGLVVNPGKADNEQYIRVNDHLAKRMKPHQIEGLRFMWREVVGSGGSEPSGCLLAHTMGLGKTMQAIALVTTLYEVSRNPALVTQLPDALKPAQGREATRIMILCPPGS